MASVKWLVASLLVACIARAADPGGSPLRLVPGDRLRVTTAGRRQEVIVQQVFQDRLTIRGQGFEGSTVLVLSELSRLDVRVPRSHPRGAYRGLDIGLPAGVFTGIATGLALGDDPDDGSNLIQMSAGDKAVVLAVVGGVSGMIIGGLIGAVWPGEEWRPVDLPVTLDVSRAEGGCAEISLSWAY